MPTRRDPRAPCRPQDPPSLHERLIRGLIDSDPRMCRNGFWRTHNALLEELGIDQEEAFPERPFMPDAYLFDRDRERILCFEVEVSCPMSEVKLFDYGWFWYLWDCESRTNWTPTLFTVDRYGHRNEHDLRAMYWRECVRGGRDERSPEICLV